MCVRLYEYIGVYFNVKVFLYVDLWFTLPGRNPRGRCDTMYIHLNACVSAHEN